MDIRILFGSRKGQIVDVENESAQAMLKDGRAENPYLDQPSAELTSPVEVRPKKRR